jgi:phenylacetate-CoA ligase
MLEYLHRRFLLPAFEGGLKRRKTFPYWKELEQSQWLSIEELEVRQLQSLQRLLSYAGTNCPYYGRRWTELGLNWAENLTREEFTRFPVIDRSTVRENRQQLRSQAPGIRLLSKSTGGSTGAPLSFDYDSDSLDRRFAAWHRGYGWAGARPGTKQFYFWGVPLGDRTLGQRGKDMLYNWLYRRSVVSCFDFREDQAEAVIRRYNHCRPDVLVAYTTPLYYLARAVEERQLRPHPPQAVIVGAEKLYPFQRRQIERAFRAPVFETYGTREFMLLGAECDRHQGLHLSMENCLIEILTDDGRPTAAGEEGNVVVTDLTNYGMPFIRYANGDRAVAGWKTCSCGRGLPLLTQVVGRRLDIIRTPDGRLVPGEFFPHLLKDYPAVRRFQVVQDTLDCVQLHVVLNGAWSKADQAALEKEIRRVLGPAMRCNIAPVSDIPVTAAGKHQVVVNRCPAPGVPAVSGTAISPSPDSSFP